MITALYVEGYAGTYFYFHFYEPLFLGRGQCRLSVFSILQDTNHVVLSFSRELHNFLLLLRKLLSSPMNLEKNCKPCKLERLQVNQVTQSETLGVSKSTDAVVKVQSIPYLHFIYHLQCTRKQSLVTWCTLNVTG